MGMDGVGASKLAADLGLPIEPNKQVVSGKTKIDATVDTLNPDAADNEVEAKVEWQIGDDGKLGIGASDNPSINGTDPNFILEGGVTLGTFGLEAEINNFGTSNQDVDVTGELGIADGVSIRGGVENIGGNGGINGTLGVSKTEGDTKVNVEGDFSGNDRRIELNIERILK